MSSRRDSGNIEEWVTMIRGGRVAQLAEHLDHNQGVTGSSPVPPTMFAADAERCGERMRLANIRWNPNDRLRWPAAPHTRTGRNTSGDASSVPGFFLPREVPA